LRASLQLTAGETRDDIVVRLDRALAIEGRVVDEFGVIMPETTGEAALSLMGRLSDAFVNLGGKEGVPAAFGMSFGLSAHPEDEGAAAHLVKLADERLLLNKREK
jgi:GGDEF domain-containing protein